MATAGTAQAPDNTDLTKATDEQPTPPADTHYTEECSYSFHLTFRLADERRQLLVAVGDAHGFDLRDADQDLVDEFAERFVRRVGHGVQALIEEAIEDVQNRAAHHVWCELCEASVES